MFEVSSVGKIEVERPQDHSHRGTVAASSPSSKPTTKQNQIVSRRVAILRRDRCDARAQQKSRRALAVTLFGVNKKG
jgi:hypothetical protein